MASAGDQIIAAILADIKAGTLKLPVLPEVAVQVRRMVDDDNSAAAEIASVISKDASLSTRLLQVSNSPFYQGTAEITSVHMAVARLGRRQVRNLVTSLLMQNLFETKNALIKKEMVKMWEHNSKVAALTLVLASRFTTLNRDQALLAGLIHDVGKLPVMTYAERFPELLQDVSVLNQVGSRIHCPVGRIIMKTWKLPDELVAVAGEHENIGRDSVILDYADLVIIANAYCHRDTEHELSEVDWHSMPALHKLGLNGDNVITAIESAEEEAQHAYAMMG